MMAEPWPETLSMDPLVEGYDERVPSNIMQKQTDAGIPLRARRFTSPPRFPLSVTFTFERAEVETFLTWHEVTLADGLKAFSFTHPRSGAAISCYFVAGREIQINPRPGAKWWDVRVELEIVP